MELYVFKYLPCIFNSAFHLCTYMYDVSLHSSPPPTYMMYPFIVHPPTCMMYPFIVHPPTCMMYPFIVHPPPHMYDVSLHSSPHPAYAFNFPLHTVSLYFYDSPTHFRSGTPI